MPPLTPAATARPLVASRDQVAGRSLLGEPPPQEGDTERVVRTVPITRELAALDPAQLILPLGTETRPPQLRESWTWRTWRMWPAQRGERVELLRISGIPEGLQDGPGVVSVVVRPTRRTPPGLWAEPLAE